MDYDREKVDEMALALLWLTASGKPGMMRAWKSLDWGVLDRLHEKDCIFDPKGKAKSVVFTEEGEQQARELFEKHFGVRK